MLVLIVFTTPPTLSSFLMCSMEVHLESIAIVVPVRSLIFVEVNTQTGPLLCWLLLSYILTQVSRIFFPEFYLKPVHNRDHLPSTIYKKPIVFFVINSLMAQWFNVCFFLVSFVYIEGLSGNWTCLWREWHVYLFIKY